ncbi:hypothetical protein AVEN_90836-1 [Araneus ventricosus]|uniref:Serpin domain-containing protein n=1 Tax=Araneus ventricosus TaxID=182803 RepID=A0A4Y1ZW12_ARAVE|nr:hypothetical protein AVEN_97544-1 [Araneus ventricosus]GBL71132.1 hypothetical protein AVEN_90836-1 [Araneus ventricosus]
MTCINVLGTFFVLCVALISTGAIPNPPEVARENIRKLTLANNELAFNLHRKLISNSSNNVFFSPLSISIAFGMLFYGTSGDTAEVRHLAISIPLTMPRVLG